MDQWTEVERHFHRFTANLALGMVDDDFYADKLAPSGEDDLALLRLKRDAIRKTIQVITIKVSISDSIQILMAVSHVSSISCFSREHP